MNRIVFYEKNIFFSYCLPDVKSDQVSLRRTMATFYIHLRAQFQGGTKPEEINTGELHHLGLFLFVSSNKKMATPIIPLLFRTLCLFTSSPKFRVKGDEKDNGRNPQELKSLFAPISDKVKDK